MQRTEEYVKVASLCKGGLHSLIIVLVNWYNTAQSPFYEELKSVTRPTMSAKALKVCWWKASEKFWWVCDEAAQSMEANAVMQFDGPIVKRTTRERRGTDCEIVPLQGYAKVWRRGWVIQWKTLFKWNRPLLILIWSLRRERIATASLSPSRRPQARYKLY